jgi:hypothetical protein
MMGNREKSRESGKEITESCVEIPSKSAEIGNFMDENTFVSHN